MPLHIDIDLTTTQQEVLGKNPNRVYALFVNDSDAVHYLSLGIPAVANKGIRLNAGGGAFEINLTNPYTGRVYGISAGATKRLMVTEY